MTPDWRPRGSPLPQIVLTGREQREKTFVNRQPFPSPPLSQVEELWSITFHSRSFQKKAQGGPPMSVCRYSRVGPHPTACSSLDSVKCVMGYTQKVLPPFSSTKVVAHALHGLGARLSCASSFFLSNGQPACGRAWLQQLFFFILFV